MHIEQLKLTNYRNYEALDITFDDKVNVIIGENAQGKTNLMEAIYVLSFTRSHRTMREKTHTLGFRLCYNRGQDYEKESVHPPANLHFI